MGSRSGCTLSSLTRWAPALGVRSLLSPDWTTAQAASRGRPARLGDAAAGAHRGRRAGGADVRRHRQGAPFLSRKLSSACAESTRRTNRTHEARVCSNGGPIADPLCSAQARSKAIKHHHRSRAEYVLWVPNASGVMRPSSELVYDDAQWMVSPSAQQGREDARLTHPSLPHDVAQRLGLNSLRYQ
eukprot:949888-Pyramimonas_sp.AAC.1